MKKVIQYCMAVALLTAMTASVGQAAATADVSAWLDVTSFDGLVTVYDPYYSESYAYAANSVLGPVGPYTDPGFADTGISASIGNAYGQAETHYASGTPTPDPQVNAWAGAAPTPGSNEGGYGLAQQSIYVQALSAGTYSVTADYATIGDFAANLVGDIAGGSVSLYLDLWIPGDEPIWLAGDGFYLSYSISDGQLDLGALDLAGELSFETELAQGIYELTLWADAEALATSASCHDVIPAPAAIVLVGLGSGLVGWMRRRRAI